MTEIGHSGCKLLLGRRMFIAMASSIVAQFIFMSCVILIMNLSITHPLNWLHDAWTIVTCFRMWCYFIVLAAVILLQGVICSKNYLTAAPYAQSRFDALRAMLTPHNFIVGSLHIAVGLVLVWLHLNLEGGEWSSLTRECKTLHATCLVEEHYFLLLGGLWMGLYHFASANFSTPRYLEFPAIPQSKFVQVRRGIAGVLPASMISALTPSLYLLALYYFLGGYFRRFATLTFFLAAENEPLDAISRLLNVSLIFHAWLYATLFFLTMNTMHLLFQACLAEWTPFEIDRKSLFTDDAAGVTLQEALSMDKVPIMQHLGFLDLATLALKDKNRRASLFALSQPGGHPYNWNFIVQRCLGVTKNFTDEINHICAIKQDSQSIDATRKSADLLDKQQYAYHMRNLVTPETTKITNASDNDKAEVPNEQFIVAFLRNKRDNFLAYLLSKPLIFYFFGQRSDAKIRHVLINGQTVVWAADAISLLAVVSLKEDPYGIVQKDLSSIIENLLMAKQALDKLQKTNLMMRKPQNDDRTIRIILTSLRMGIKRSIYRIVSNFRDYIEDLSLEPTIRDQLQSFLACRE